MSLVSSTVMINVRLKSANIKFNHCHTRHIFKINHISPRAFIPSYLGNFFNISTVITLVIYERYVFFNTCMKRCLLFTIKQENTNIHAKQTFTTLLI